MPAEAENVNAIRFYTSLFEFYSDKVFDYIFEIYGFRYTSHHQNYAPPVAGWVSARITQIVGAGLNPV